MEMNGSSKTAELLPSASNLAFVEGLYEDYLRDPASVPPDWQRYLAGLGNGEIRFHKPRFGPSFRPFSIFNPPSASERQVTKRSEERRVGKECRNQSKPYHHIKEVSV